MRFIQSLNEPAADYVAMINPVLAALRSNSRKGENGIAVDLADEWRAKINQTWNDEVAKAKADLRKADRITWYLRFVRATIVHTYSSAMDEAKLNKLRNDYISRSGLAIEQDGFNLGPHNNSLVTLCHYLSLPIAAIRQYQFRFQSYHEVISDFQELEDKWKDSVKDTLEDNDAKILINCGNDWFWVNTQKAYCSKEAAAMGHCGNAPRQGSDDELLSLRKKIMFGNEVRWQPHLTFILASDGYLTEMKGKANEKPSEKYFPMIVQLLESDIVTGIRGGGYMPGHNFSMADLDDTTRDKLIAQKPELGSVGDLYEKYGNSDVVFRRIEADLQEYGLSVEEYNDDTIVLATFDSLEQYFRNGIRDSDGEKLASLAIDADFDDWLDPALKDNTEILNQLVEAMDEEGDTFLDMVAHQTGARSENAIASLIHMFPKSLGSIWGEIRQELQEKAKTGSRKHMRDVHLACYGIDVSETEDGGVTVSIPFRTLAYDLAAYKDEDYDDMDGFDECIRSQDWLATRDSDYDDYPDDDDLEHITEQSLYEDGIRLAIEHIKGLLHDDSQMSFDF